MVLLAGDVIFGINREEFRDSTLIITLVRYSTVLYVQYKDLRKFTLTELISFVTELNLGSFAYGKPGC